MHSTESKAPSNFSHKTGRLAFLCRVEILWTSIINVRLGLDKRFPLQPSLLHRGKQEGQYYDGQVRYLASLSTDIRFRAEVHNLLQQYGSISSVSVNPEKGTAFVTFVKRDDAQVAIYRLDSTFFA